MATPQPDRLPEGVSAQDVMEIVQILPDVLFRCHKGPDGRIYWSFNEGGLAKEFHLTTDEIQGKALEELFPGGASDSLKEHFEAAFRGERRIFTNEIAGRHFRHYPQPIVGADGKVHEVVGFIADVTELVEAERRLAAANDELEAFVYSVSHDLRNPLAALSNLAAALQAGARGLDEKGRHVTSRMRGLVDRMEGTLQALLWLSRSGRKEPERRPVDLSAQAHEVADTLQARDPDRRVRWEIDAGLSVVADAPLVHVLLENLLGNAWKYTSKSPGARITVRRDGDTFEVADNGVGFNEADAPHVFDAFRRLHGDAFEGSGIGLATVKRIVERHGGRIEAHGEQGKGARFRFTLAPSAPASGPADEAGQPARTDGSPRRKGGPASHRATGAKERRANPRARAARPTASRKAPTRRSGHARGKARAKAKGPQRRPPTGPQGKARR